MTNVQTMQTTIKTTANTREFLKVHLKQLEPNDKALVIRSANKYTLSKRTRGDVNTAGNEFFNALRQTEAKYGIAVFSPEENTLTTMETIAEAVDIATNKLSGIKTYFVKFRTASEANLWLQNQKNIVVKDISVDASCHFGVHVNGIQLEYTTSDRPVTRRFCVCEDDTFRVYASSNPKKYCNKWQEKNRPLKVESYVKKGSSFSLIGGNVGFLRFIKEKYFMLCSF